MLGGIGGGIGGGELGGGAVGAVDVEGDVEVEVADEDEAELDALGTGVGVEEAVGSGCAECAVACEAVGRPPAAPSLSEVVDAAGAHAKASAPAHVALAHVIQPAKRCFGLPRVRMRRPRSRAFAAHSRLRGALAAIVEAH